jgi:general secretion pathway protein I
MNILKLSEGREKREVRRAGFTLLEVMIAVAILAITLTVLFGSQSQSLSLAVEAKFNTRAMFLLGQKFAELEGGFLELQNEEGDFGDEYPDFRWKVEINDADLPELESLDNLELPLKQVALTIFWADSPFSHSVDYYVQERSTGF